MFVCYHDLVGGICGRGRRDEQQLYEVIEDMRDFEMLFAIGKADSQALSEEWWNDTPPQSQTLSLRLAAARAGQSAPQA
jgi:hypothetical protein